MNTEVRAVEARVAVARRVARWSVRALRDFRLDPAAYRRLGVTEPLALAWVRNDLRRYREQVALLGRLRREHAAQS